MNKGHEVCSGNKKKANWADDRKEIHAGWVHSQILLQEDSCGCCVENDFGGQEEKPKISQEATGVLV